MKILVLAALLSQPAVFGDESEFSKQQGTALEEIDQRAQKLQELKACVEGASDKAGMQKCRASMKEFRSDQRAERKERRQERRSWGEK